MKSGILKVLAYFDLFDYPVSSDEIRFMMDRHVDKKDLLCNLNELSKDKCLFQLGDFYSLSDDKALRTKRLEGNERAKPLLEKAKKIADLLSHFPYVRGIAISGSLSKNYADLNADIDLFIITKANRLWIARTFLHLLKKLTFLIGHQHWFCMNYFIDEEALLIEEKNIFTATELITLIPVSGEETMNRFFRVNDWAGHFFPNYGMKTTIASRTNEKGKKVKKIIESVFNSRIWDPLDNYFEKLTTRRWATKEKRHKLNMKGNRMGLMTGRHFSKPNPVFFQEKLLNRYRKNLEKWEEKWAEMGIQEPSSVFLKEII